MSQAIAFIGSSALGLELLGRRKDFALLIALCLNNRVTPELEQAAKNAGVELLRFDGPAGLRSAVQQFASDLPFFIYQLDMLVPAELAHERRFFNVHRGNMMTNRGPTPDVWPILNGDACSSISLHRIDDKVDAGWLIHAVDIALNDADDPRSVCRRMEQHLPELLDALAAHLRAERPAHRLEGGLYRPWVTEADFSIDLERDSSVLIDRKIRSQRPYNGALLWLGSERNYVTELIEEVSGPMSSDRHWLEQDRLIVVRGTRRLVFRHNPLPKYPPLPARPPSRRV